MTSPPHIPENQTHEPSEPSPTHEPSETHATPDPFEQPEEPDPFEQPEQPDQPYQSATPEQTENPEPTNFLRTVVDFESLQFLRNKTFKKVVPKPVQPDVNILFQNFLTEVQAWLNLLKEDRSKSVNPAATDLL